MATSKLVIGLTGGIGSGKTAAANFFHDLGISIIDADVAARKVVEPGQAALQSIVKHFGNDILLTDSGDDVSLDRTKLRTIIFSDPEQRTWLNNLLHPLIADWMDEQVALATSSYVIKVIPLLFESDLQQQVDRVLVIDVSENKQTERVTTRDNSSASEIKKIIQSQTNREHRLAECDDVINNDSSLEDLEKAVLNLHNKYLKLAADYILPSSA